MAHRKLGVAISDQEDARLRIAECLRDDARNVTKGTLAELFQDEDERRSAEHLRDLDEDRREIRARSIEEHDDFFAGDDTERPLENAPTCIDDLEIDGGEPDGDARECRAIGGDRARELPRRARTRRA